ncbi:MAG: hypothetical protein K8U57_09475 [Planctomycetes bacterium]|nr:hypothetical protein [Planctomycetota bacterium]
MRLTADAVLAAITHPEPAVRELAVNYFTSAFSVDPRVMPAFIQSIERYGWEYHEDQLRSLSNVIQTEATVRWLLDQFTFSAGDDARQDDIACVLVHAPAVVLKKFEAEIAASSVLPDDLKTAIQDSIVLLALPPEELWRQLEDECGPVEISEVASPEVAEEVQEQDEPDDEEFDDEEFDDEDFDDEDFDGLDEIERSVIGSDHDHLKGLAAALGAYPEFAVERVRTVLRKAISQSPQSWRLPEYAARIARHARLTTMVPELVEALSCDKDFLSEEAQDALAALGSDTAIELIQAKWSATKIDFHLATMGIFEATHTDRSVEVALSLAASADDEFTRNCLFDAALRNFDSRALDAARQLPNDHSEQSQQLITVMAAVKELLEM